MNKRIIIALMLCLLVSIGSFAQSKKKSVSTGTSKVKQSVQKAANTAHIGTWRLISQKITFEDGRVTTGDSSNVFTRKILTPTTFVVIIEQKIPSKGNKKMATSVAGGHYTLVDGKYEELTEYAAFDGFETMKVNYILTVDGDKLHTVGTVGGPTIYDETYIRED
jgi:type 1 fimbria pilin